MHEPITGQRILITGGTGQVAEPVARALATDNEVYALARFRDPESRTRLEGAGIRACRSTWPTPIWRCCPTTSTW